MTPNDHETENTKPKRSGFASVSGKLKHKINLTRKILKFFLKHGGTNANRTPSGEIIHMTKSKTIFYKILFLNLRKLKESIDKCLQPMWNGAIYAARRKCTALWKSDLRPKKNQPTHQGAPKILELLLLPTYPGKCTSKTKIEKIPPEIGEGRW